jgi:hypothetical protein
VLSSPRKAKLKEETLQVRVLGRRALQQVLNLASSLMSRRIKNRRMCKNASVADLHSRAVNKERKRGLKESGEHKRVIW